jgi:hypothetical protein
MVGSVVGSTENNRGYFIDNGIVNESLSRNGIPCSDCALTDSLDDVARRRFDWVLASIIASAREYGSNATPMRAKIIGSR